MDPRARLSGTRRSRQGRRLALPPSVLYGLRVNVRLVDVGYRSTHYYLIQPPGGKRLLFDCGWPGTIGTFRSVLKRNGVSIEDIGHILVSHFHPDHAGLVQEVKDAGALLIVTEAQIPFVKPLERIAKPDSGYLPIRPGDNVVVNPEESREFLKGIGLDGEILSTPGHSPDSVSLILDEGLAFTGDLPHQILLTPEDREAHQSWARLKDRGVHTVYPAHGPPVSI